MMSTPEPATPEPATPPDKVFRVNTVIIESPSPLASPIHFKELSANESVDDQYKESPRNAASSSEDDDSSDDEDRSDDEDSSDDSSNDLQSLEDRAVGSDAISDDAISDDTDDVQRDEAATGDTPRNLLQEMKDREKYAERLEAEAHALYQEDLDAQEAENINKSNQVAGCVRFVEHTKDTQLGRENFSDHLYHHHQLPEQRDNFASDDRHDKKRVRFSEVDGANEANELSTDNDQAYHDLKRSLILYTDEHQEIDLGVLADFLTTIEAFNLWVVRHEDLIEERKSVHRHLNAIKLKRDRLLRSEQDAIGRYIKEVHESSNFEVKDPNRLSVEQKDWIRAAIAYVREQNSLLSTGHKAIPIQDRDFQSICLYTFGTRKDYSLSHVTHLSKDVRAPAKINDTSNRKPSAGENCLEPMYLESTRVGNGIDETAIQPSTRMNPSLKRPRFSSKASSPPQKAKNRLPYEPQFSWLSSPSGKADDGIDEIDFAYRQR